MGCYQGRIKIVRTSMNIKKLRSNPQGGKIKEKSARERILAAAAELFASRTMESITVNCVLEAASVAKGTFYAHFDGIHDLVIAIADEFTVKIIEVVDSQQLNIKDPVLRVAIGCNCFIERALQDEIWGILVARMATAYPHVGILARRKLLNDLQNFLKDKPEPDLRLSTSGEVVIGIVLQVIGAISQKRLGERHREASLASILRAIGVRDAKIRSTLAQLRSLKARENITSN